MTAVTTPTTQPRRVPVDVETRIERLERAAAGKVIDPDRDLPGSVGAGQVLPDELLTTAELPLTLTPEQRAKLSREEVASMLDMGARMESILNTGFSMMIAKAPSLTDPRVRFLLHEIGEETRHQRMFIRVLEQLGADNDNPLRGPVLRRLQEAFIPRVAKMPALFHVMVLAGEEIPDLLQKLASEHPGTDPFLATVNRYHRAEEARHISYAKTVFPELWAEAGPVERFFVRAVAPKVIRDMFHTFVHPGVYSAVGLPKWKTWRAVNRTPRRLQLRHEATRPILRTLLESGVFEGGLVTKGWQELCHVDERGNPLEVAAAA